MLRFPGATASLAALMLVGCGVGEGTGSTPPWADTETPVAPAAVSADETPPEPIDPFQVRMQTTKGDIVIDVHPEWAPRGAARFKELVESGYYDDNRIFRVVTDFVVQFGMHGDPETNRTWSENRITDDPVTQSNKRGYVTFATSGSNARTTQIFINLKDNPELDSMAGSFAPFGEVIEGMDVVESFNAEYGGAPSEKQPAIMAGGNKFLDAEFPGLDSIVKATIISPQGEDSVPAEAAAPANDAGPPEADAQGKTDDSTTQNAAP
jgi:peptidyl-prolyl cis-trans isomerase A (cyclophilin A)